ncbi:hypothetical protein ACI01nite_22260 [Acetobacter cibinongensis]|uniref:Outer membrane protein n=1 Tax=Acetobacter cibinongensis TaxID=146475 RepID=A0A0D6N7Q8_9PROT|nr:outer membrane protein [Acetobacter cibinongensis]GEL59624.1 hypothetical protein ACI01nite_22260 [Acetobacter cibinongensis]
MTRGRGCLQPPGGQVSGVTLTSGGQLNVTFGGTTASNTVKAGGQYFLLAGTLDSSTTNIFQSGADVKITTDGAGHYGSVTNFAVTSGVGLRVQDGATGSYVTVSAGGQARVLAGGSFSSDTVLSDGTLSVSAGGTTTGTVLRGGTENVTAGGSTRGTVISAGGEQIVSTSATASQTVVQAGAVLSVSGGTIRNAQVSGTENVYSGGVDSGSYIAQTGVLNIYAGAYGPGSVIDGTENLYGLDSGSTINSTGVLNVYSGGVANGETVYGHENVYSDGVTNNSLVTSQGQIAVSGGVASTLTVTGSGAGGQVVSGGTVYGLVLASNGQFTAMQGGSVSGGDITGPAGWLYVSSGGIVAGLTVSSGGQINMNSGAVAVSNTIGNGGQYFLLAGTLDSSANNIFTSGADIKITSDGHGNYAAVRNLTVGNGVGLRIQDGATGSTITVSSGGSERVFAGGTLSGSTVMYGGNLSVSSGGTASGVTLSGGKETIFSGGVDQGATVYAEASQTIQAGGSSVSATIISGNQVVSSGGVASAATVSALGYQLVSSGGVALGTTVSSAGYGVVASGGIVSQFTDAGGTLTVSSGGSAVSGTLLGDGSVMSNAGSASNLTISNGATASNTGQADGVRVENGATLVNNGGVVSNVQVDGESGSFLLLSGSAQSVVLTNGAYQEIDGGVATALQAHDSSTVGLMGGSLVSASFGSGASLAVYGGSVSALTLESGSTEYVQQGASVSNQTLNDGVTQQVWGGTASAITVNAGGLQDVETDGIAVSATLSGGSQMVNDGGSAVYTTVLANGTVTVSGGTVLNTTISATGQVLLAAGSVGGNTLVGSGALLSAASGVTLSGNIVDSGMVSGGTVVSGALLDATNGSAGGVYIGNGGSAFVAEGDLRDTTVLSGATLTGGLNGSYSGNTVISNGGHVFGGEVHGTLTVSSGADVNQLWVTSGGVANIQSGATLKNAITVRSAGTLIISSGAFMSGATVMLSSGGHATLYADAGGTVLLDDSTNTSLVVSGLASGGTLNTVISAFNGSSASLSDGIEIAGLKATDIKAVSYPDADHVTLTLNDNSTIHMNIVGAEAAGYSLQSAADGNALYEVCFLAGSMIRTASGDVAVEDIRIGDSLPTWDWQARRTVVRPVVWVGRKHVRVNTALADADAGYPVRVLKGALADGVPCKDLLITPEHSLFFENKLVPVRMLVNNQSIFYDRSLTSYDYFHVETDKHALIWANDVLSETYLDTGNRSSFRQDGAVARLAVSSKAQNWQTDAVAPLGVSRSDVEPLFASLKARAGAAGLPHKVEAVPQTDDAGLHLVTPTGQVLHPLRQQGQRVIFAVPSSVESVRLVSRTARPSEVIGPFIDDRRDLGILVGKITVFDGTTVQPLTKHLEHADLAGWDVQEASPCRWTNGAGFLPLGQGRVGLRLLTVQILAAGPYLQQPVTQSNAARVKV